MAGKIKQNRIVTFTEDWGRYKKGDHAMNVVLADKLSQRKAPIKVKEVDVEKYVTEVKARKTEADQKAEEALKKK